MTKKETAKNWLLDNIADMPESTIDEIHTKWYSENREWICDGRWYGANPEKYISVSTFRRAADELVE